MSQASCGVLREDSELLSRLFRKRRASSHYGRGLSWFFFGAAARRVGFLTSYVGELREPLVWPQ